MKISVLYFEYNINKSELPIQKLITVIPNPYYYIILLIIFVLLGIEKSYILSSLNFNHALSNYYIMGTPISSRWFDSNKIMSCL